MTLCVGLTGGIGCGKSTASALFAECGATVIDSDVISHQLTQPGGQAVATIRKEFGEEYIDATGALDRVRMRQRVFSDATAKHRLEAILHPLIRTQILAQVNVFNSPSYTLLVIPLLFETPDYQELVQHTIVVDCPETTQLARAMQRSGLDEPTVRAIMATQMTRVERLRRADEVIQNEGDLVSLRQEVTRLHRHYLAIAARNN